VGLRKKSKSKKPVIATGYQPGLFGFIKPVSKVPISAARIKEVIALIAKNDGRSAAKILRDIRLQATSI
jgi:hypothetical protein